MKRAGYKTGLNALWVVMLGILAVAQATSVISPEGRACLEGLDAYLKHEGVGCYFGSDDSRRTVLDSFMGDLLSHCDLEACSCPTNGTAVASCDGFAAASLVGYVNLHSPNAAEHALYTDMKEIIASQCMEQTGDAGVPPAYLISPSFGACAADNAVSAHTGGIGAYIAVYAGLFALVMIERTERSRYTQLPTEEVNEGSAKQAEKPVGPLTEASRFL